VEAQVTVQDVAPKDDMLSLPPSDPSPIHVQFPAVAVVLSAGGGRIAHAAFSGAKRGFSLMSVITNTSIALGL
jgi:hypothetical protein